MSESTAPQLLHHFRGSAATITHCAFHPTEQRLASASTDHRIQLWSFAQKRLRCYVLAAHAAAVTCVAWSPTGECLASASADRTARLWIPTEARTRSGELRGHCGAVLHCDFNPSGRKLCTASADKTVKYWSATQARYMCTYAGHTAAVRCAQISHGGEQIASCGDDRTLRLWDVRSQQEVHVWRATRDAQMTACVWQPADRCVAVAQTNERVKMFDLRTRRLLQMYQFINESGDEAADGDGNGGEAKAAANRAKGAAGKENARGRTKDPAVMTSLAWHPDGMYMVAGSRGRETRVLDLNEGRLIYTMLGHAAAVETVAFSADGGRIATGGADSQIMVWSFTAKKPTDYDESVRGPSTMYGAEALTATDTIAEEAAVGEGQEGIGNYDDDYAREEDALSDDYAARGDSTAMTLNPSKQRHDYERSFDDYESIEITHCTADALPEEFLKKTDTVREADRFNADIDVVFEQVGELRALVDSIEQRVNGSAAWDSESPDSDDQHYDDDDDDDGDSSDEDANKENYVHTVEC